MRADEVHIRRFNAGCRGTVEQPKDGLRACESFVYHFGITMRHLHDFDASAGLLLVRLKDSAGTASGLFKTDCLDGRKRMGSHSRDL